MIGDHTDKKMGDSDTEITVLEIVDLLRNNLFNKSSETSQSQSRV
jgi:hypothetical protein